MYGAVLSARPPWIPYALHAHDGFRSRADPQVLIHMLQVLLDRTGTDPECQRDFFIGEPLSQPS